jgi:translation initiation factor IF-2
MNDDNGDNKGGRTLTLRGGGETTRVRQSFSHGRSKSVVVEKKRKRIITPTTGAAAKAAGASAPAAEKPEAPTAPAKPAAPRVVKPAAAEAPKPAPAPQAPKPPASQPAAEAPAEPVAQEAAAPAVENESPAPAPPPPSPTAEPRAVAARRGASAPAAEARPAEPAPKAEKPAAKPAKAPEAPAARQPQRAEKAEATPSRPARSEGGSGGRQGGTGGRQGGRGAVHKALSKEEHARRLKALELARKNEDVRRKQEEEANRRREVEAERRRQELEEMERREAEEKIRREREEAAKAEQERAEAEAAKRAAARPAPVAETRPSRPADEPEQADSRPGKRSKPGAGEQPGKRGAQRGRDGDERRRSGKLTIEQLTTSAEGGRQRSLAAMKRRQEKARQKSTGSGERERVIRDVTIPDAITVQELANRMAERSADVVKSLMKMGMMATINQTIDADTAQLIVEEFGHKVVRVSESDVENVIETAPDSDESLKPRAPVVTVMGHVDHGKTSLLDALRKANVVSGEAGGITQHIGAYQVQTESGADITFLDTPGHAAFTSMRARGASVTDIVILVVAADDSVMPQTIEAINHAKAAKVPMIVAINKVDKPSADADKVRQELLQHEVFVEKLGGDVLDVEVSALKGMGLDTLLENIALQAELLDLKANPERAAEGAVIEAKLDVGRGPVATVLVQRGTLRPGDTFVVGEQWGKVRALIDDKGDRVTAAGPSVPVEVLGLNGTPEAGDVLNVVESEAKAREIADYRQRKAREKASITGARASLDQLLAQAKADQDVKELPIVVKADVQGSAEAIVQAVEKIGNEEVRVRILHSGVGAITESDVQLADASNAPIIGFNVRANAPARESANQKGVEIRYYSVIYNLVDDVKAAASGLLSAEIKETFIGYAEIRQVFKVSGVGKVAGCYVTEGVARRQAGVRLLRDDVVIHEGTLKTLKRFKDEVREVQSGQECGMAFANYDDIREGDVIEIFTTEEIERSL